MPLGGITDLFRKCFAGFVAVRCRVSGVFANSVTIRFGSIFPILVRPVR